MEPVESLILEYQSIEPSPDGEDSRKREIIAALDDWVGDAAVVELFAGVLANENEYDLARIEICKIFRAYREPAAAGRSRYVPALVKVLRGGAETLVRQWAAIGAVAFVEDPEMMEEVTLRLLDQCEDEDVRHNCLEAIEELRQPMVIKPILLSLVDDPVMGRHVARILEDVHRGA